MKLPAVFGRVLFSGLAALLAAAFALPLIWFLFAPFNARAEMGLALPSPWTLSNFLTVFGNSYAVHALWNSLLQSCLLYTSPSPRDRTRSRMPSSA